MKNTLTNLTFFFGCFILLSISSYAQLVDYTWPTGSGEAVLSDKYRVFVTEGNGTEQEVSVLMSTATYAEADARWSDLEGRTFSFVNLSYNPTGSNDLTIRVEKIFGSSASSISVHPKSYNITPSSSSGLSTTFTVGSNQKYFSVHFDADDNRSSEYGWIEHMLAIFVDPLETDMPDTASPDLVYYSNTLSSSDLANARTIYFQPGHHNLKDYQNGGNIDGEGVLYLSNGQEVYIEGGAFVEGIIDVLSDDEDDIKIYGRGILSGRQYDWRKNAGFNGVEHDQLIRVRMDAIIDGISVIESMHHGIVGSNRTTVKNVKLLGWHANNDGLRLGRNSETSHSFIRAVDDHFYNFDNYIHDCVIWAGHNGAIITYGWGGTGSSAYNSGSSIVENIDVIHPEWLNLGNNNGIIASQVGYDYQPYEYDDSTTTVLRNFRVEGSVPGIVNLKARSGSSTAIQTTEAELGYLGDLVLEFFEVEDIFESGQIRGETNPTSDGSSTWIVKNIHFQNIVVGDVCLDANNVDEYIDIDPVTTSNITFDCGTIVNLPPDVTDLVAVATSCNSVDLTWTDVPYEDEYRVRRRIVDNEGNVVEDYTNLTDLPAGSTTYTDNSAASDTMYEYVVRPVQDDVAVATSNKGAVTTPATCLPPDVSDLVISEFSCNSVTLVWSDIEFEDEYRVRRRVVDEDGEIIEDYTNLADVPAGTVTYTDNTVSESTIYQYVVRPVQADVAVATSNRPEVSIPVCITLSCDTDVMAFPYTEGFESNDGWIQLSGDDGDWTRDSNGTPSRNTGPTSAVEGSYYLYLEASNNGLGSNATAILESPCFDLSGESSAAFTFQYHMYGSTMGSLALSITSDDETWTNLWSLSGNQSNQWEEALIDLSSYVGRVVKLRFTGTTGSGWRSDVTIDDLELAVSSGNSKVASPEDVLSVSANDNTVLYPNPANGAFINLRTSVVYRTYSILDLSGKHIQAGELTSETIDISVLKPGSYFVEFRNNTETQLLRFIKE